MTCTHPWTVFAHVLIETRSACGPLLDNTEYTFELTPLKYLGYFTLTFALELPFVYFATGKQIRKALLTALGLNLATHPLVCFYFVNHAQGRTFGEFTLAAEGFAFTTEMLQVSILYRHRAFAAAAWVFAANFVSWTIGSFL